MKLQPLHRTIAFAAVATLAMLAGGYVQAQELVQLLKGQLASVNLIPINPVAEKDWRRPSLARIEFFANYLLEHHITATVRREMGNDIQAACGQLRNKYISKS